MNIGLCGLEFGSGNLGCSALSFSFLSMLREIEKEHNLAINIYVITQENCKINIFESMFRNVQFVEYHLKNAKSMKNLKDILRACEFVFDFTAGDSFSDIYGLTRFVKTALIKSFVNRQTKLILAPQTYGPFESVIAKVWGKRIIANAYRVFARDNASSMFANKIANRDIEEMIDVAFTLPYQYADKFSAENKKINIGFNVSGLLWNGGYTGKNQFSLVADYRKYCVEVVKWLLNNEYCVHLVGHVNCRDFLTEDDIQACEELNRLVENRCINAQVFATPMEAKTYISRLDCFIGARMHATIAAISSNCAVIPFAYSRKFNGLFHSIKYPFLIDGKSLRTEEAIASTKEYLRHISILEEQAKLSNEIARCKIEDLKMSILLILRENERTENDDYEKSHVGFWNKT